MSITFEASESLAIAGPSARDPKVRLSLGDRRGEIVASRAARTGVSTPRVSTPRVSTQKPIGRLLVVLGAILAMMIVAGALARPSLVLRVLPRLASAYAAVGMPVNLRGFAFEHVGASFEETGGGRFLAVEGILRNVSRNALDAPRLRVTVSGADGRPIYFWTTSSGVKALPPGEVASFRARLASPPAEARAVTVDFVPDQDPRH